MPGCKANWRKQMNKKLFFTVPISLILVACGGQNGPVPKDCVVVDIPGQCANAPAITINREAHTARPPNYCAKPGEDIKVRVTSANGPVGTVVTKPKIDIPKNAWLNGTNDPDPNGFVLTASATKDKYYYKVEFKDGYCIDPRISVE
jgi:hypothetical protein